MRFTCHRNLVKIGKYCLALLAVLSGTLLVSCANTEQPNDRFITQQGRMDADKLLPVDCLLPSQVRKLGSQLTYLAPRNAIKTTALDCEVRGGEYVAFDRADYRTALLVWLDKAKQGDAEAQTYVGEIYEKGLGLPADYPTAFSWYSKAADQGFSRAQINLGYLYEKGLGVNKDMVSALNWYRRASGVEGSDLDYSSAIEIKAATLAEEKTAILRQEVNRREAEIEVLNVSLLSMRQQLQNRELLLAQARASLSSIEQKMSVTSDESSLTVIKAAYTAQKQKVQMAEEAISELKANAVKEEMVLTRKAAGVSTQKRELSTSTVAGPSIEIFDPSVAVTRSGVPAVHIRAGSTTSVISGKILAPAGLRDALLNSRPLSTDSSGIFHTAVTVVGEKRDVSIVASDTLGRKAEFSFLLVPDTKISTAEESEKQLGRIASGIDFGRYYALVIGNNEYKNYPTLKTAVNDAQRVADVLETKYGFHTRLLTNADRYTILSALNEIKGKMTENDNLLVYYAGHGERDTDTLQGYWLPVDAEQENTANWIPNSAISELLNTMKVRHILVVADSCYSGSMTRSSVARLDAQLNDEHMAKWLRVMAKTSSRTVLTSGGLEPVLDSGGGMHSVFAKVFLQELEQAKGAIDAYKIYLSVSRHVQQQSTALGFEQIPTYAPIQHTGHSGGEFIFIKS